MAPLAAKQLLRYRHAPRATRGLDAPCRRIQHWGCLIRYPHFQGVIFFPTERDQISINSLFLGHLGQSKLVSQISISPIKSTMPLADDWNASRADWPPINHHQPVGGSLVRSKTEVQDSAIFFGTVFQENQGFWMEVLWLLWA